MPRPDSEEEQDDALPLDQWMECGGCQKPFFCVVQRSRPTFIPLFCEACDAASAPVCRSTMEKAREQLRRKIDKKKKNVDMDEVVKALTKA